MSVKVLPNLLSDDPVADDIEVSESGSGVVKSPAQPGTLDAILCQPVPHGKERHALLRAQVLHFLLYRFGGVVARAEEFGHIDYEEPRAVGLLETKHRGAWDASGLLCKMVVASSWCGVFGEIVLVGQSVLDQPEAAPQG